MSHGDSHTALRAHSFRVVGLHTLQYSFYISDDTTGILFFILLCVPSLSLSEAAFF